LGDKEAFYSFAQPCERGVFAAAMSILNDRADAEEVTQEAILKAFSAMPRFRGDACAISARKTNAVGMKSATSALTAQRGDLTLTANTLSTGSMVRNL
jgi:hypothetical protein